MRRHEFIAESANLEEIDLKKALGTAALATGIGLGGLGYKYYGDSTPQKSTIAQGTVQQKQEKKDLRRMSKDEFVKYLQQYSNAQKINWNPVEFNQFLAQVFHETKNFTRLSEDLYYTTPKRIYNVFTSSFRKNPKAAKNYVNNPIDLANLVYANKYGNGDVKSGDGWKYRGRGLLHITGRDNYERIGRAIGVDLVNNPDLLITDANVSIKAAMWYWKNITAKKLADKGVDFTNVKAVTKTINPALAGIKDRAKYFKQLQQKK